MDHVCIFTTNVIVCLYTLQTYIYISLYGLEKQFSTQKGRLDLYLCDLQFGELPMADSQMRRTDSEETLMLPGRDGQPEQQQEPPCPGRDGQPEQQQEPPCSQPFASDHEETFPDTDPSSQLDADLQHYSWGGMTVAVQNSPSPMAFMLAGVVAQMMEKGNGKGKNEKGGKEENEKGGNGKNENKDGKGYKGPQQRGSGSDQPGAQHASKKTKKK